ncbi:MAG: hypothetical protein JRI22_15670 [Deltaproteobacteria bacterium]|nr:hypothetical protein [Deltaproteobacteria bacterium]
MKPVIYFVVVIDADPTRSSFGANNDYVMKKYNISLDLVKNYVDGKGTICVHTSPRYRNRFFNTPFIEFWEKWTRQGGELILHPEEDLYSTPETALPNGTYYNNIGHMKSIIKEKISFMKQKKLPFATFRGAFFGFTNDIARVLRNEGLNIDLSGAPGIVRPERAADWSDAPTSAYYLSNDSYRRPSEKPGKDSVFEIPLGWDGQETDVSRNYLFHERSTYRRMCKVWDAIVERGRKTNSPQFVNFLCHSYSMKTTKLRNQCEKTLLYMRHHNGVPVVASEAKKIYNELFLSS